MAIYYRLLSSMGLTDLINCRYLTGVESKSLSKISCLVPIPARTLSSPFQYPEWHVRPGLVRPKMRFWVGRAACSATAAGDYEDEC